MFTFGDPVEAAKLYAESVDGGTLPPGALDDYENTGYQVAKYSLARMHAVIRSGIRESIADDVLEVLVGWYDEMFAVLMPKCPELRERTIDGRAIPPTGWGDMPKYRALVEEYLES